MGSIVVLCFKNNGDNRAIAASIIRGGEWALRDGSGGDPSGCVRGDKCVRAHRLAIFISFPSGRRRRRRHLQLTQQLTQQLPVWGVVTSLGAEI